MKIPPLPPLYLPLGLVAIYCLQAVLPGLNVLAAPPAVGLGLMALGGLVALAGALSLFRHRTTIFFSRSSTLVTGGIFGRTRNPLYLAQVLTMLGAALLSGNLAALIVPLAVFAALARHAVPLEEAKMEEEFGQAYVRYRRKVRRWL